MRTEAALSLGVLLFAAAAGAQTAAAYRAAVERYRGGATNEAVEEVSSWPEEVLHREAREAFRNAGRGEAFPVAAAAMLHTDCARLAAERSDAGTFDVRIGEAAAFVQVLQGRADGASFARRWYLAVGYDLVAVSATVRARRLFEDGLRRFPEDRDLRLAAGSVAEMEGSRGALARAEAEYRRVLEADAEVGEAHLRRGRVLAALGRTDEALHELQWVRQRSEDPRLRYLALLFQGRIEESGGQLEAAAASYRSAVAQDPAGQTGHLALAHALDGLGDRAGAAEAVRGAAPEASRHHEDGWWLYRFGQAHRVGEMLDELRREAARPPDARQRGVPRNVPGFGPVKGPLSGRVGPRRLWNEWGQATALGIRDGPTGLESLGGIASLLAAALGQPAPGPPPVFSAGVEAVYLDVFVTSHGRAVAGLTAADFEVRDNDVPQVASVVDLENAGLAAALVFDSSGSVAGEKLSQLKAAGHAFIDGLGERDSASLLTFSQEVLLPVAATRDRAALHRALDRIGPRGATAVRDALYVALRLPRGGGRPMVVLFTDGEDTLSWLTPEETLAAVRQSDVRIEVVASPERRGPMAEYRATVRQPDLLRQEQGVPATPGWERAPRGGEESPRVRFLRQLAETTGGALWTAASSDLPRVFRAIVAATPTRYVLSYEPRGVSRTGRHRLKVSVKGRRVEVRARTEYVVPCDPTPCAPSGGGRPGPG